MCIRDRYLMHALMDNIPIQIYFKDLESRFIRIDKGSAMSFGLNDPRLAIGKTDFDFFTHEHAQQAFDDEQNIIGQGSPSARWKKKPGQIMQIPGSPQLKCLFTI